MSGISSLLISTAPLFIAAMGALLSEYSGRLNIGLEGGILFGAFSAALVHHLIDLSLSAGAGNAGGISELGAVSWIMIPALLSSFVAGALSGGLLAFLTVRKGANVFIAGLGINLLAWGIIPMLRQLVLGSAGVISLRTGAESAARIAGLGVIVAILLCLGLQIYLNHSTGGLRLRRIYQNENLARMMGTNVDRYQGWSLVLSTALAGLAGGFIALHLGSYVPNLSAGKGWIALVIVFLGNRKLLPMAAAALLFALSQLLANELQRFLSIPGLLIGLPYGITLLALIIYRLVRRHS